MRKITWLIPVIILISVGLGYYFYPLLPEYMASHWNIRGEVDGYVPRFWGAFLFPTLLIILWLLFLFFYQWNKAKLVQENWMQHYFVNFIILLFTFLLYIYFLTILWNIGYRFNLVQWLSPAFGGLFYYVGVLTGHAKRNWFVGIRTPWTLRSEVVWDRTHALGGKLFRIVGILALLGIVFPNYSLWFMFVPLLITVVALIVYSAKQYKRLGIESK